MAIWKYTVTAEGGVEKITLPEFGPATTAVAARILNPDREVVGEFLEAEARAKRTDWDAKAELSWRKGVEWVTREHVPTQGYFLLLDPGRPTEKLEEVMA
jgi:hypothetical protein